MPRVRWSRLIFRLIATQEYVHTQKRRWKMNQPLLPVPFPEPLPSPLPFYILSHHSFEALLWSQPHISNCTGLREMVQLPAEVCGLIAAHVITLDTRCGRLRNPTSFDDQAQLLSLAQVSRVSHNGLITMDHFLDTNEPDRLADATC